MNQQTELASAGSRRRNRRAMLIAFLGTLVGLASLDAHAAGKELTIYFIDVEGGQSTLLVTPDHHGFMIDTGFAGAGKGFHPGDPHEARDANRILAAAKDAGLQRIDDLLITHFHSDHDGGVGELSQLLPIRRFIDHGSPSEGAAQDPETKAAFEAYAAVRGKASAHLEPHLGGRLPIPDLNVVVVSTAGETLSSPLPNAGGINATCPSKATPPRDPYENPRSTGVVVRFGRFRLLDVGDLTGQPLFHLACPKDLIGPVDVYLVAHHGGPDVSVPETFAAFKPRVAVMNNGPTKGGSRITYEALHQVPGLEVWQLHSSGDAGESNFPPRFIANLDDSTAHWIKLVAKDDGSFRVTNPRTGESKSYAAR